MLINGICLTLAFVIKHFNQMSFSHYDVSRRTAKNVFYTQINQAINWQQVENEINKYYSHGQSAVGKSAYPGILLFKMLLVGFWSGSLSDRAVEEMANENLSVMKFLGLRLEDTVPDHSCLSRFRSQLAAKDAFDKIMTLINNQLDAYGVIVKTGVKIDATVTDSPRKPRGKATYQIAEDRKEDELEQEQVDKQTDDLKIVKVVQPGVDLEGRWVKKAGKTRFGFKKHIATDDQGLILSVTTTAANVHDSKEFKALIQKAGLGKGSRVLADKAYKSKEHDLFLKENKIKNGVHYKAVRGRKLTERESKFNQLVSKTRYTVERTFGSKARWFRAGTARYVGQIKTHAQHVMESIAYNLKRAPRLLMRVDIPITKLLTVG